MRILCSTIVLLVSFTSAAMQMKARSYWDCQGGSCDARTLDPWSSAKYRYSPVYAPLDPGEDAEYGEKMWMTGAFSDFFDLGEDDSCCGLSGGHEGGCGKCILVTNPDAVESSWKAVIMKKTRCPPDWCKEPIVEIAVPGFHYESYSRCEKESDLISEEEAKSCADWWIKGSDTSACDCKIKPGPEKDGCELFKRWGWKSAEPTLTWERVKCPAKFAERISKAFDGKGLTPFSLSSPTTTTSTTTSTTSTTTSTTPAPSAPEPSPVPTEAPASSNSGGGYCNWNNCDGKSSGSAWCSGEKDRCEGKCGGKWCPSDGIGSVSEPLPSTDEPVSSGGGDSPTPPQPSSTAAPSGGDGEGFCAWKDCSGATKIESKTWCNAKESNCTGPCNGRWCISKSSFAELKHQHREVEITAHGDFKAQNAQSQDDEEEVGMPTDQEIEELAAMEDATGQNREEDFLGKKPTDA